MNKFKLIKILIVFILFLFYSKVLLAENLYINSPELSHLEKIKNIKNKKKQKPRKDGVTYVGQKKLILQKMKTYSWSFLLPDNKIRQKINMSK